MSISSSVNLTQLNTSGTQGDAVRQDYSVAVAVKINDQAKQEGAAVVKLIESAPAPVSDGVRGGNLATYA
jgi:hypothetical protein